MKTCTIIAGVPGVGKTSFLGALKGIDDTLGPIVDGDAVGFLEKGESFVLETTLSDGRAESAVQKAREMGYHVRLCYIGLDTAEESLVRIENRVAKGGSDIEREEVLRCFSGRFRAVARVLPYCDEAEFYDNDNGFEKVAEYRDGGMICSGELQPKWLTELCQYLKETVLAWDPDYTKVTPGEKQILDLASSEMEAGEYVAHDAIGWN